MQHQPHTGEGDDPSHRRKATASCTALADGAAEPGRQEAEIPSYDTTAPISYLQREEGDRRRACLTR